MDTTFGLILVAVIVNTVFNTKRIIGKDGSGAFAAGVILCIKMPIMFILIMSIINSVFA